MKKIILILTITLANFSYAAECGDLDLSPVVTANSGKIPLCSFKIDDINKSSADKNYLQKVADSFNKMRKSCTCPGDSSKAGETELKDAGQCSVPRSIKLDTSGGNPVLRAGSKVSGDA